MHYVIKHLGKYSGNRWPQVYNIYIPGVNVLRTDRCTFVPITASPYCDAITAPLISLIVLLVEKYNSTGVVYGFIDTPPDPARPAPRYGSDGINESTNTELVNESISNDNSFPMCI